MTDNQKIFIGVAWPYANGSLHLGHVAALLGADVLARYWRAASAEVLMVSGSDCHGTPIVVAAEAQGVEPTEIAQKYHKEFAENLIQGLKFSYDLYTTTTTPTHEKIVQEIFLKLYNGGYIYKKIEELPYCPECKRFLPDRYIEGECPKCHYKGARGDQCDECGSLLDPRDLINPKCKVCGTKPEWRESEHFFLKLSAFEKQLTEWVKKAEGWRGNAKNFTLKYLEQGLHDRAITRDTEYGVSIPLVGYESKRIYVWFEAVSGYWSASQEWASEQGDVNLWKKFWQENDVLAYYVHGKDNIPFHTIIWPAMLLAYGGLKLPDRIISSEYLTLEKKQFSTSRQWAVWLPDFLAKFPADTLRYYLIANGPETADADFTWPEFQSRVNAELIGNFGNFVHRILSFIAKYFLEGVDFPAGPDEIQSRFIGLAKETYFKAGVAIGDGHFREALKDIFNLIDAGNKFVEQSSPWAKIKDDREAVSRDLAVVANVIANLSVLLKPFLPQTAEKISALLSLEKDLPWRYFETGKIIITNPLPIFKKIEDEEVEEREKLLGKE
jgi:methionyl-tRNA synthetase